jgi:hypothetical protein
MLDFTIDLCKKNPNKKLINGEPKRICYVPYIEEHYRIDCSVLNKYGVFKKSQLLALKIHNQFSFEVEFMKSSMDSSCMDELIFRYQLNNVYSITKKIKLSWQERTFGRQPYFLCPSTGNRVKYLILVEGVIKTRHQLKMHYSSEHENLFERSKRGAEKIRNRFCYRFVMDYEISLSELPKPLNQHHSTWKRWCDKELLYYERVVRVKDTKIELLMDLESNLA